MPTPRKGESQPSYIKRCIPVVLEEGTAKSPGQAYAICRSMYHRHKKHAKARQPVLPAGAAGKATGSQQAHQPPLPTSLCLQGEIKAASLEPGNSPRFTLIAYTGKPMQLEGFRHPVLVDMDGATFDKQTTPIIADHDTSRRIGHTTEQLILRAGERGRLGGKLLTGPVVAALGIQSSKMQIARGFVEDAREGFPFQVSIGAKVKDGYVLDEGETAVINGREYTGPLVIVSKCSIRELSVTVLGADNDTSANIAATAKRCSMKSMKSFDEFVESLGFSLDKLEAGQKRSLSRLWKAASKPVKAKQHDTMPAQQTAGQHAPQKSEVPPGINEQLNIQLSTNLERIETINSIYAQFCDTVQEVQVGDKKLSLKQFKAHAIRSNMSPELFELECRRADYPRLESPAIHSVDRNVNSKVLECAILRQYGLPEKATNPVTKREYGLSHFYDAETLEASHHKQYDTGLSIGALYEMQIRAVGRYAGHLRNSSDLQAEAVRAWQEVKASGFSTLLLTSILENVMHKAAYAGFESVEGVWRQICGRKPLNDFKSHALYRLDFSGRYRKVAVDGELKHVSMVDTKKTIAAETYGCMITIDRKTRVNDDLGLVIQKAQSIGLLGGMRLEESVFVLLLSNPGSFFHTNNNNLISGSSSALSIDALTTAEQKFRDQVINGYPISVTPTILLHGTQHAVLASRLYNQTRTEVTTTTDTQRFADNPHAGKFRPVMSGYLNNTAITDENGGAISGQSSTQWYLFANPNAPQGAAIVVGFLNGRETPFFDEAETQFNVPGGMQFRSYHDWGVAMHITQMALKSAGA